MTCPDSTASYVDAAERVALPEYLQRHLKPHQVSGVRFLWRCVVGEARGAILAHSMGLGKTIQTVAFVHVLLSAADEYRRRLESRLPSSDDSVFLPKALFRRRFDDQAVEERDRPCVAILCPPILLANWQVEWERWIPPSARHPLWTVTSSQSAEERKTAVLRWSCLGGVLLLGYPLFIKCCADDVLSTIPSIANLVIADEGHLVKNLTASLTAHMRLFGTPLRVALTGYPLQNNLMEYWCMVDWARPGVLPSEPRAFYDRYARWIKQASFRDATDGDKRYAARLLYVLTGILAPFIQRLSQADIIKANGNLFGEKRDFVIRVGLSPLQHRLYCSFLEHSGRGIEHRSLFAKTGVLQRICNHPQTVFFKHRMREEAEECVDDLDDSIDADDSWMPELTADEKDRMDDPGASPKMLVLRALVEGILESTEDGILVFSRSIPCLDYIQNSLLSDEHLFRMDGMTPLGDRLSMISSFNSGASRERVFLISIMTGSLGINLTRANRVILVDIGWNPCHDEQAIGRAHRLGQLRPCVYVYRLQTAGTVEERLYRVNVHKQAMTQRVIDRRDIQRSFSRHEVIQQGYFADPPPPANSDDEHDGVCAEDFGCDVLAGVVRTHPRLVQRAFRHHDLLREEFESWLTQDDLAAASRDLTIAEAAARLRPPPLVPPSSLVTSISANAVSNSANSSQKKRALLVMLPPRNPHQLESPSKRPNKDDDEPFVVVD